VAIAAIKAIERIAQLPEPFDAHPNQISRSEYRSSKTGGVDVCGPGGGKAAQPVVDVKALHAKIGELQRALQRPGTRTILW
jgi:hypothetical protein